jgi:hypothetical protein
MAHHKLQKAIIGSVLSWALLSTAAVQADTDVSKANLGGVFNVSGNLRLYDFNKAYSASNKNDSRSSAAGGVLRITTVPFLGGFSLGLGLYKTYALEIFPAGSKTHETTLMGANPSITTVGEAYAQFARDGVLVRAGRQIINTPWMSQRDSRMIPQTFEGVWGQFAPMKGLTVMATRVNAFKSRDSDGFHHDNLYYPNGFEGDELYGTTAVFPKSTKTKPVILPEAKGAVAVGARYKSGPIHTQVWFYNFYDFARTAYVDGGYVFGSSKRFQPYVDAQYMHQTGGDMFTQYNATLHGIGGEVNSTLWGLRGGAEFNGNNVSLAYNKLADHENSFGGGSIISPYGNYTAMYAAVMASNLLSYGPGDSVELAYTRKFLGKKVKFKVAALKFHTTYSGDPKTLYLDASYHFSGKFKGLSLRERMAVTDGGTKIAEGTLVYNRVMLQYVF